MANGIVNAGGSFGQFTVIPLAQLFIGIAGWQPALVILGAIGLLAVPLIVWITQGHAEHAAAQPAAAAGSLKQAVVVAIKNPSYLLLTAGFFTCGFLGAWLGGKAFEATGSFDWMWWADIALCLIAAALHLPIREAKFAPARAAPAAAA
jgi:predicted MFS family arabinose efflux permease